MICGGLNNETTMVNGGSLTKAINHILHELLHLTHLIKAIAAGTGILVTALNIMLAAVYMLKATTLLCPAIAFIFGGFFWVLGVVLLCTAFIVLRTMLNSFAMRMVPIRRREYAYAYINGVKSTVDPYCHTYKWGQVYG